MLLSDIDDPKSDEAEFEFVATDGFKNDAEFGAYCLATFILPDDCHDEILFIPKSSIEQHESNDNRIIFDQEEFGLDRMGEVCVMSSDDEIFDDGCDHELWCPRWHAGCGRPCRCYESDDGYTPAIDECIADVAAIDDIY